jgi:hypothetical protein
MSFIGLGHWRRTQRFGKTSLPLFEDSWMDPIDWRSPGETRPVQMSDLCANIGVHWSLE